jgi:hypothetical protein
MGIPLGSSFTVNVGLPLDDRLVVLDLTARDAILAGRRYEGMQVYVKSDTNTYTLKGGLLNASWAVASGGGGASFTGSTGYSTRFNEAIDASTLQLAVDNILKFGYVPPAISASGAGSGTLRERGDTQPSAALSATTTKTSRDIQRVEFFRGATSIFVSDPVAAPTGGLVNYTDNTPFSNNVTYTAQVTDIVGVPAATTVTSNSVNYNFVYPYYFGAGAVGLTPAAVSALTKQIINSTTNANRSFTATSGQVYYFAYPAAYPALTSILDANGFEVITDWTATTGNIVGLDTTSQSYRIYEFNNPVVAGTTSFTFKQ